VTGGQLFWQPPLEGLRVGASYLRASIDFNLSLDADSVSQLVMAGLVPSDYDGRLIVSQRPTSWWVASAEYTRGAWLFAAEYMRAFKHQETSLPELVPTFDEDKETFYAMATYRLSPQLELGGYYSILHADAGDRRGRDASFRAFQRDLTATLRLDVNEYWLWKLEAHFIDGTADLVAEANPNPTRYWGLFLCRTTVTF
jgi:predicted porin